MLEILIHRLSGHEHLKKDVACNVANITTPNTPFEDSNYAYSKYSVSVSQQEAVLQLRNLTYQSKKQADYLERRKQRKWVGYLKF